MSPLSERPSRIWCALERIEGELFAVERALEQIDEGVYEGFAGLPEPERVDASYSTSSSVSCMARRKP